MSLGLSTYPKRIVCLNAASADILYRLGAWDRVVGISGFTRLPPGTRHKPKIGGFTTIYIDKVLELKPDLVISYSHLQASITEQLVATGVNVLALNQRSLPEILDTIILLGSLVRKTEEAHQLASSMAGDLEEIRKLASDLHYHPRVFFEEWGAPIISASRWIAESIELAGGVDIFPELRNVIKGRDRSVDTHEVRARDPEVIVASWCGKKVELESIHKREGWADISAVKNRHVHWIKSKDVLEAGPSLVTGVKEMYRIIAAASSGRSLS